MNFGGTPSNTIKAWNKIEGLKAHNTSKPLKGVHDLGRTIFVTGGEPVKHENATSDSERSY